MICFIDFRGNTQFVKTIEELKKAYKNGYVREAFKSTEIKKWEKIDLKSIDK